MLIGEKLAKPFHCDEGGFCPLAFFAKLPIFCFKICPLLCSIYSQAEKKQRCFPSERFTGRRKGQKKKPYHDLNNAVLGVFCHDALHLPVAHHTPEVTLALLILAYCAPPGLVFSAVGAQLICKTGGGKKG